MACHIGQLEHRAPTGNAKLSLGSGLIDYYLNSIFQKTLSPKNTLRVNAGLTFAGNTLTGAVGIKTRGTVFTGGTSFARQFTPKLDLGLEIYAGHTVNAALPREALQKQLGGELSTAKDSFPRFWADRRTRGRESPFWCPIWIFQGLLIVF
jgi:hypothetical protein